MVGERGNVLGSYRTRLLWDESIMGRSERRSGMLSDVNTEPEDHVWYEPA